MGEGKRKRRGKGWEGEGGLEGAIGSQEVGRREVGRLKGTRGGLLAPFPALGTLMLSLLDQ